MAAWFVLQVLAVPIGVFVLGWACHAILLSKSRRSAVKLLGHYLSVLVLAYLGLPIPLATLNLLPVGQQTNIWHGRVVACERPPLDGTSIPATLLVVRSPEIGPLLRLRVSQFDYVFADRAKDVNELPPVEGLVVRGFMGVPVACRWKSFVSAAD